MQIVWTILLIIVLLIVSLLFCPFCIQLIYNDQVTLKMGYLFPVFKILPQKPKPEKPAKKKSKEATKDKKTSEKKKKKNPILTFTKKHGLDGLIELLKEIVAIVLKLVDTIRKHLYITKLRLDLLVVGEDPADTAMKYGYACSAIYPMIAILDKNVRLRKHEEYIDAGFNAEKTQVRLIMKVYIMPIFVVIAAVSALIGSMKIFQKMKQ